MTTEKPKGKGPRGRKPEKVQISVRIDLHYYNQLIALVRQSELKQTDVVERGIVLAVTESLNEKPLMTQARFVLQYLPPDIQRLSLMLWSFAGIPRDQLSEVERRTLQRIIEDLLAWRADPRYRTGLDSYTPEDDPGLELCQRVALKGQPQEVIDEVAAKIRASEQE